MAGQVKVAEQISEYQGQEKRGKNQPNARGIWIFIEQIEGEIAPVSLELLGAGRGLADALEVELAGVIMGYEVGGLVETIFSYGPDKIYLIDDPMLKYYRTKPFAHGLVKLAQQYQPEILLMGATSLGRDLSGYVATELKTGLTADCTELSIDLEGRLLEQTRPAFGGNIMATILCREARPQMASVRPRVLPMPLPDNSMKGELVRGTLDLNEEEIEVQILDHIDQKGAAVFLDKAEIIVAGGRGIGSKENFALLKELAETLGGTLGASRAAVEADWLGMEYQVGQTGITVRPKVYFAIGISGAIQHLVGMQSSDVIVAINNDPDAPIFKVATIGIVGDHQIIVPELTRQFRERLEGRVRKEDAYE